MKWIKKVSTTPLGDEAKVIDSLEGGANERQNAPSIHAVKEGLANVWQAIYPIGSIYMSVNAVDPSTLFGGTWVQIKDKFLLSAGNTYTNGATGGEATHTLTVDEIPSHDHDFYIGQDSPTLSYVAGGSDPEYFWRNTSHGSNLTTVAKGGGGAHNNLPPYLVVNVWQRTA